MEVESEVLKELKKYVGKNVVVVTRNEEYYGKFCGFKKSFHNGLGDVILLKGNNYLIIRGGAIKLIKFD